MRLLASIAAVISISTLSLLAQAQGDLKINLVAKKVLVDAQGKEQLVAADRAKPGEVIDYSVICFNGGKNVVREVSPKIPIPTGLEYIPNTAKPPQVEASLDGVKFQPIPIKRRIKNAEGKEVEQEVPASEFKALRWNIGEIAAGQSKTVSARARVSTNSPVVLP